MGSPNAERQQDFLDLAVKNGLTLTVFDEWVGFDEFLNRLPTVRGKELRLSPDGQPDRGTYRW